jgi:hypothetical protein
MIYKNLLVKIKTANLTGYDIKIMHALQTVVKLHKPTRNGNYCFSCDNAYPCKTIQVIKKTLVIGLDNDN